MSRGRSRRETRSCRLFIPRSDIQFELPSSGSVLFQTAQLQCSNFRYGGLKIDRNELSGIAAERGFNGCDFLEFVVAHGVVDHVAGAILSPNRRRKKTKHGGFSDHEGELLRWDIRMRAFLHAEGRH